MSLNIYINRNDIPDDVNFIESSDMYFESQTLRLDDITSQILADVDKAVRFSDRLFMGRSGSTVRLPLECLSTGAKTLLCILYNPYTCFSLGECGDNVVMDLFLITNGHVFWRVPRVDACLDGPCDIMYYGNNFTKIRDFRDFLDGVADGD